MRTRTLAIALAAVIAVALFAVGPTSQASASGYQVHCIKHGETLYGIAYRYGVSAYAIAHYNGIMNPNYIVAGRCLKIPHGDGGYDGGYDQGKKPMYGKGGYDQAGYDQGKKPMYGKGGYDQSGDDHGKKPMYGDDGRDAYHQTSYGDGGYGYGSKSHGKYCVRYGDTLSGIASWFGVSTWALAHANGLHNPNYIRVGQCLWIPGMAY